MVSVTPFLRAYPPEGKRGAGWVVRQVDSASHSTLTHVIRTPDDQHPRPNAFVDEHDLPPAVPAERHAEHKVLRDTWRRRRR